MPSPFPGMDPWIEDPELFPDFHHAFCIFLKKALNAMLPDGYFAKTSTIVWTEPDQRREPDVSLLNDQENLRASGALATMTMHGLLPMGFMPETVEQLMVEIHAATDQRLVTAFELLSPSNKFEGAGRNAYRKKQQELVAHGVHLIELDFLRAGNHTTLVPLSRLRRQVSKNFAYHISALKCAHGQQRLFATGLLLEQRLPQIGVPLDRDDQSLIVDLQPIMDDCYTSGSYHKQIKYHRPPMPPLTPEQQLWADEILRAKGVT